MKKTYLVPSVKYYSVKIRPVMQATSGAIGDDINDVIDGGGDAKSIWDDETADGFNW